jgi:hypothetical protein
MMQRALVRAADIHAGFLAHGLETFEFSELGRAVIRLNGPAGRDIFFFGRIRICGHKLSRSSMILYVLKDCENNRKKHPKTQFLFHSKNIKKTQQIVVLSCNCAAYCGEAPSYF